MEKVVIFGVGKNWELGKERISRHFQVIGFIDNNWERISGCAQVKEILNMEYDKIIVTPSDYESIILQLHEMGITDEKIILYEETLKYEKEVMGLNCWGQYHEDLIIASIFGQLGIENPTYMDLGANHPFNLSNTAMLYGYGCKGINVDANPNLMKEFEKRRPGDINLNIGVSIREGTCPFYMFEDMHNGRNTFSKTEVDALCNNTEMSVREIVDLPVVTLETIIDDYCNGVFPDFLDCDIEGLDYEVLKSYDLEKNGPKVMCVEVRPPEIEQFDAMLFAKGYFKFCRMGGNNIYVRNEYRMKLYKY